MKKIILAALLALPLAACGNSAYDNEVIGQAKKIINHTNLVCMDYKVLDLSLGVVRNGTGSMSKEDLFLVVTNEQDLPKIKNAVEDGALVKVHYNTRRWTPCSTKEWMTSADVLTTVEVGKP